MYLYMSNLKENTNPIDYEYGIGNNKREYMYNTWVSE